MVAVVIGDRTYEVVVPFKLRQIRQAAPFLDLINANARAAVPDTSVVAMGEGFRNMLGAILPGIQKADPSVTLDQLEDDFDPSQWQGLRAAFSEIFNASGIGQGEAAAAAEQAPDAA